MRITPHRPLAVVALIAFVTWGGALAARARGTPIVLPVEVVGEDGTTVSVTVDVPSARAREVRSLWVQVHGLGYAGMASVQVNNSAGIALSNDTASVAEPGRSYGGIGGGFGTLKLTVALPANTVVDGTNTIRFRFNHTDGIASAVGRRSYPSVALAIAALWLLSYGSGTEPIERVRAGSSGPARTPHPPL